MKPRKSKRLQTPTEAKNKQKVTIKKTIKSLIATKNIDVTEFGEDNVNITMNREIDEILQTLDEDISKDEISKDTSYLSEYLSEAIVTKDINPCFLVSESTSFHKFEWIIPEYSIKGQFDNLIIKNITLSGRNWTIKLQHDKMSLICDSDGSAFAVSGEFIIVGVIQSKSVKFENTFTTKREFEIKDGINYKSIMKNTPNFLQNDTLTLICQFNESKLVLENGQNKYNFKKHCTISPLLSQFEIPMYPDIEFSVKGAKFFAHSVLMQLRCLNLWEELKQSMMNNNVEDIKSKQLCIVDNITPMVFHELLRFIYIDEVHNLDTTVDSLVSIATKYEINPLKDKCERFFIKSLSPSNALQMFTVAHMLNLRQLTLMANDVILDNLQEFSYEEFQSKYFPFMNSSNVNEDNKIQQIQRWTFKDINCTTVELCNIASSRVQVGNEVLDFKFEVDNSKNISLAVLPQTVHGIKWINVEIVVQNDKEQIIASNHQGTNDFTQSSGMRFYDLIESSYFTKKTSSFIVHTSIWILQDTDARPKCDAMDDEDINGGGSSLIKDLDRLFNEGTNYDVKIIAENEEFYVHKFVIASHSVVFNELFERLCSNQQVTSCIEIEIDANPETIREMLRFFYTGRICNVSKIAADMLKLAFMLKIDTKLIDVCEETLSATINSNNVVEMVKLADLYNSENLKADCLHYLEETHCTPFNFLAYLDQTEVKTMKYNILQNISKIMRVKGEADEDIQTGNAEVKTSNYLGN